jgi:uncharacterized protein involved in outer membrane biogenesis
MTKRLKIILIILGSLILLGGVGAWYAASIVDPARLTKLLINSVKSATGRDLKIAGPVTLSFFPRISVSAERLSLSNAAWADASEMLSLKRIEMNLKTLPLLREEIEIASLKLSGLELFLQKNASGKLSWDMSAATPNTADHFTNASSDTSSTGDKLIFMENVSVLDARVWYQDATSPASSYQIKRLSLAEGGDKTLISLSMQLQDQDLELAGKMGSLTRLFKQWDVSLSHFPLDLNLTMNGKSMMIQGEINKMSKALPSIDLVLNSTSFDWPALGATVKQPAQVQQPITSLAPAILQAPKSQSSYLFSNKNIPFDVLPQVKGRVVIHITELNLPKRKPIENLQATLQLDDGIVDIPRLTLQMGKGSADIQVKFSQLKTASPAFSGKGITKDFTLESLLARVDPGSKVSGGNMKLAFDIKTSGRSLHQMAENSSGKIQMSVNQARMGTNFLNDAGDFVVTLLDSINPMRNKTNETILECAVAYLPISRGQINIANTVGVQTDRLDIVLAGSIDLKTEAVNLAVDPREKSGLTTGIDLAGMIKMGGTLMHPKAGINQAGVVNSAVSIGLGILTGGASILAENARSMTNKSHPCHDVLRPWSDIYPGAE